MKLTLAWPAPAGARAWLIAMTCAALGACGSSDPGDAQRGDRLAPLPIADGTVTVSGISAGGY